MIISLDGKAITSADQLGTAIQADKPGQQVTIGLYRGRAQMTVIATLGSSSAEPTDVRRVRSPTGACSTAGNG